MNSTPPICAALAALLVPVAALGASSVPERSLKAEVLFRLENPCPSTGKVYGACKGYVIDRIVPRVCGGAEAPDNMQWQTIGEARAKNRWERIGCRPGRKLAAPTADAESEVFPLETSGTPEAAPLPPASPN